jgi:fructan beta-fructosidase
VKHAGRDPKLVWHKPTQNWVMAVYDEFEGKQWIAFYTSKNLREWVFQSRIDGFFECPDLFELLLDGKSGESRWVLLAADGKYVVGRFDGRKFEPETEKLQVWHGNFYAAQTYDNAPEGRRVQIGWGQGIEFAGMPFNQQMVIPVELTLRKTADGPRMFAEPVRELAGLHGKEKTWSNVAMAANENPLADVRGTRDDLNRQGFSVDLTEVPGHDHNYYALAPKINLLAWEFLKKQQLKDNPQYEQYRWNQ